MLSLLLLLPLSAFTQLNRSATMFARENIHDYLDHKIFKGRSYEPIYYGSLDSFKNDPASGIVWSMDIKCESAETASAPGKEPGSNMQQYNFVFYLDKKMKVLRTKTTW